MVGDLARLKVEIEAYQVVDPTDAVSERIDLGGRLPGGSSHG